MLLIDKMRVLLSRYLKRTSEYPDSVYDKGHSSLRRKLRALSLFSPVLTADGTGLRPWSCFAKLRMRVGGVVMCWWPIKILLLPQADRKPISPANPQTGCKASEFNGELPGVGVAQIARLTGPMCTARNSL